MSEPAPEQDAVRRLLAQARHDEPLPDDVALRLDRVLDGLHASAGAPPSSSPSHGAASADATDGSDLSPGASPVALLDTRRQRRRAVTRLLIAAAVVLAGGIGIGQVIGDRDNPADTASQVRRVPSGGGSDSSATTQLPPSSPSPGLGYTQLARRLPLTVDSSDLDAGARSAVGSAAELPSDLQDESPVTEALTDPLPGWSCPTTGAPSDVYGSGTLLPATYDGTPVVLALRPAKSGEISVEVLACSTGGELAHVTVDAS